MNAPAPRVPSPVLTPKARRPGKPNTQLFVLVGLAVLFVGVLAVQFGGGSNVGESTPDDEPTAQALTDASGAEGSEPNASELKSYAPENNPLNDASGESAGVAKNIFSSIWNTTSSPVASSGDDEEETPPPAVVLSGTLTSATRPVAFINGSKHVLGDMVGSGWVLHAVGTREVTLRSPTGRTVVVTMPTLSLH
jgi:hypothetical protein